MKIKIVCVGKINEKYFSDAIAEYQKRLSAFANVSLIEVKESNMIDEGKLILNHIRENDFLVSLEIEGKEINSIELAKKIEEHYTYSNKDLCFVIGGSDGLSLDVKERSDYKLSFGRFTYPHQLMRVILYEQIYRAFTIINNKTYHK